LSDRLRRIEQFNAEINEATMRAALDNAKMVDYLNKKALKEILRERRRQRAIVLFKKKMQRIRDNPALQVTAARAPPIVPMPEPLYKEWLRASCLAVKPVIKILPYALRAILAILIGVLLFPLIAPFILKSAQILINTIYFGRVFIVCAAAVLIISLLNHALRRITVAGALITTLAAAPQTVYAPEQEHGAARLMRLAGETRRKTQAPPATASDATGSARGLMQYLWHPKGRPLTKGCFFSRLSGWRRG
jgi:hypothetical protein